MAKSASPSKVLMENLTWLMGQYKDELDSQEKISAKTSPKVSQRTVSRAINGKVSTTIRSLEGIAHAFKAEAWQLLHPTALHEKRAAELTEAQLADIDKVRKVIEQWEPAQRDFFRNSSDVKELLRSPPYPEDRMEKERWSAANKEDKK